jgi:hypothetical protein
VGVTVALVAGCFRFMYEELAVEEEEDQLHDERMSMASRKLCSLYI